MGLLSPAMLAKVRSGTGRYAWLLELALPGGTINASRGGWDSLGAGWYEDSIQAWTRTPKRSLSDPRGGAVPAVTVGVNWIDHDRRLARVFEGPNRDRVYGSPATIRLAEASLPPSGYFTYFAGIVSAWPAKDRAFDLELRTDDLVLERYHGVPLTQSDWPAAETSVWGQHAPRVYGKHHSFGSTEGGMLPTLLVDIARFRYLVGAGWLVAVDRVYVDGVEITSGWMVDRIVRNNRLYTTVTFATDQAGKAVTVDARGYETVGDGSGALIENPCDQFVHALNNWIWGQYSSGPWLTGAPVSSAAATSCAAFFTRKGIKGSGYIKDRIRGHDLVSAWLKTFNARGFWTNSGQLAVGIQEHQHASVYPATLYREDRHDIGASFRLKYRDDLISGVSVKHLYSANLGDYTQSLTINDPTVDREAEEALDMLWSYASAA
jgi:hypothetical protein